MAKPARFKKLKKLLNNPNLFFYDMFRKKLFSNGKIGAQLNQQQETPLNANSLDVIGNIGFERYLATQLKGGLLQSSYPPKIIIWSGYLTKAFSLVEAYCKTKSYDVKLYSQSPHGPQIRAKNGEFPFRAAISEVGQKPDFTIELSNRNNDVEILNFSLYDIDSHGIAVTRSNQAYLKKFPAHLVSQVHNSAAFPDEDQIDAVYTWVNSDDQRWIDLWKKNFPEKVFDSDRFTNNDELKFSLRSIHKYAPWISNIYIVSNCSRPAWLKDHARIKWVPHESIFPERQSLPTFNSHAIESCLHRIDELAEKFIYFNDDFFITHPTNPLDFFDEAGRSISYFEPYGMVNGLTAQAGEPDYLQASKNSRRLLEKHFPTYEARNLHKHVPYALKKSVISELSHIFSKEFNTTTAAKVRSASDINVTSFLYHHFAYITGRAVRGSSSSLIVRPTNISHLLERDALKYKFLCFNDGNDSATNDTYKKQALEFYLYRFSELAPWEK